MTIKEFRLSQKLSQPKLAKALGIGVCVDSAPDFLPRNRLRLVRLHDGKAPFVNVFHAFLSIAERLRRVKRHGEIFLSIVNAM